MDAPGALPDAIPSSNYGALRAAREGPVHDSRQRRAFAGRGPAHPSPLACRRTRLRPWTPPFAGIPRTQLDTMKARKFRWRLAPVWLLSTLAELSLVRWFIQCIP